MLVGLELDIVLRRLPVLLLSATGEAADVDEYAIDSGTDGPAVDANGIV